MPTARFDVLGIGNAIVDVIARTEEDFLLKHGMNKGTMALIDEPRAQAIYDAMGPALEMSGGSAANTIVGLASLGSRAAFIGKRGRRQNDHAGRKRCGRTPESQRCERSCDCRPHCFTSTGIAGTRLTGAELSSWSDRGPIEIMRWWHAIVIVA